MLSRVDLNPRLVQKRAATNFLVARGDRVSSAMRKTEYHHGNLRQSLLNAATRLVVEHGHGALTTKRLTADLGVTAPALYRHYRNLRDLLLAVFSQTVTTLADRLNAARAAAGDPRAEPRAVANAIIDFGEANPGLYRLINELELTAERDGDTDAYRCKLMLDGAIDDAFMAADPGMDPAKLRHHTLLMHFMIFGYVTVRLNLPTNSAVVSPEEILALRKKLIDFATDIS